MLDEYIEEHLNGASIIGDAEIERYCQHVIQHCNMLWPPNTPDEARLLYEFLRLTAGYV